MKIMRGALGVVVLAAILPVTAKAQTSPLIIDQNRTDRTPPAIPKSRELPLPRARTEAPKSVAPFTLTAVQISGASIGPQTIAAATRPFIGRMIDAKAIQSIADAVAGTYAASDVALYTVVIPDQNFAGGTLKIVVVEGFIERFEIRGDANGDLSLVKAYCSSLMQERPLRKAVLQRYVSLIRDIPGLRPDIQLLAGTTTGATVLQISMKQKDVQFGVSINNQGTASLGRTQAEADFSAFDILREGERMKLTYAAPTDPARFQYAAFSDAEPMGDDGATVQAGGGYLRTNPKGFDEVGHAETLQLLAAYPFIRSYDENLLLSGEMDGLDSDNAFFGQSVADERVRALRTSASYSLATPENLFSASGALSLGLGAFGARVVPSFEAVPNFKKLNLTFGYNQLMAPDWALRLKTTGQLTGDRLPVSEFFSVGGTDYGRAFPASTILGDNGMAASGELAWHPGQFPISALNGSEVYGFLDGGDTWVRSRASIAGNSETLASTGAGVRLAVHRGTMLCLEGARQIDVPPGLQRQWTFEFAVTSTQ